MANKNQKRLRKELTNLVKKDKTFRMAKSPTQTAQSGKHDSRPSNKNS